MVVVMVEVVVVAVVVAAVTCRNGISRVSEMQSSALPPPLSVRSSANSVAPEGALEFAVQHGQPRKPRPWPREDAPPE